MLTKYLKGDSCLPVLPRFPVFLSTALSKRQTLTELFHFITESFIKHGGGQEPNPTIITNTCTRHILPAHNLWYMDLSFLSLTWPLTTREYILNWNQFNQIWWQQSVLSQLQFCLKGQFSQKWNPAIINSSYLPLCFTQDIFWKMSIHLKPKWFHVLTFITWIKMIFICMWNTLYVLHFVTLLWKNISVVFFVYIVKIEERKWYWFVTTWDWGWTIPLSTELV